MKGSYQDPAQVHSEEILLNFAESQNGPFSYDGFEKFMPEWIMTLAYWNVQ